MAAKLKKDDPVIVIAGKDRGARGVIKSVNPKMGKAVVEGINLSITHRKQTQNQEGGKIPKFMPIELSNLAIVDPSDDKPTRVGFRMEDGKKVRFSKRTGVLING
ncbi:MAG: 50S ribosomal protein L24 [Rhodobacteraceae bacterium]|nr:50S ribosomal protein L24 [Paracoccaceae bacterium]MCY4251258.1 50S ribosomal protein L24 [Paracoccaceae bacterium]MCY4307544.1 50S ribosomal protein L24 [Paracoccaceae bacterium]